MFITGPPVKGARSSNKFCESFEVNGTLLPSPLLGQFFGSNF